MPLNPKLLWLGGDRSYNPTHDLIRSSHLIDRGGDLWCAGTGDYRLLARRLPRVDRTRLCRCDSWNVDCPRPRPTGTLSRPDWHDQLSDRMVHYRLSAVRRSDRISDKAPLSAIPKKLGIARQTPRISITVKRSALAIRRLGRTELKQFRDWKALHKKSES